MTDSPIPADVVAALLADPALPPAARQVLAQAKTYEEQCLAVYGLRDMLPPDFVEAFNVEHKALLDHARQTAAHYLNAQGRVPPA